MGFGNLKTDAGISCLNSYLADRSYIEGFQPSQADKIVFDSVGKEIKDSKHNHAVRWYRQIASYSLSERAALPGAPKGISDYGPGATASNAKDDDDDIDLFGSDDEEVDEEAEKLKKERIDAYSAKKAKKAPIVAKSFIVLDVKPWDDETPMDKLEECVRSIATDGLLWGQNSQLVPVGYGIKKLRISCVVEDDKVGTDFLEEKITGFEDFIQSMDVYAFNKV